MQLKTGRFTRQSLQAKGRQPEGMRRWFQIFLAGLFLLSFALTGCVSKPQKTQKLRDLEFTVLNKEDVPEELKEQIIQNQDTPFRLTYTDQGKLYIAEGYGEQLKTGYSVEVAELYETENAIYFHTNLLGPEKGEETKDIPTFPCVVVMLDAIDKTVVFDT